MGKQLYNALTLTVLVLVQLVGGKGLEPSRFATTSETRFLVNGRPFYANGFNAYWLMYMASDPAERGKVSAAFEQASRLGLNLARTWAFSDGGYRPLQISPGVYNDAMFLVGTLFLSLPLYDSISLSFSHAW